MPESPNQAPSRQRRANWVGLRTLRQLPTAVGETSGGEPVYEVRSVRLLLDGAAANFVRLAECSRCGRELAGAPVRTPADLDRPAQPMICTDCVRSAGASTFWDPEGGDPPAERPAPAALAAIDPDPPPAPTEGAPAEAKPERLEVLEGHLRAVTDRVNELGRVTRAHQVDFKERAERQEATDAALRVELQRLAGAHAELETWRSAAPPVAEDGAGQLREEVAELARRVETERGEVAGVMAAVGGSQAAVSKLAAAQEALAATIARVDSAKVEELIESRLVDVENRLAEGAARPPAEVDLSKVEELVATRLAEAEGRLAKLIAGQSGDLKAAIEAWVKASMAGLVGANDELAGGQAVLEERVDVLAGQVARASNRLEALLDRLDALEVAFQAPAVAADEEPVPSSADVPAGSVLDGLDRQLEAAARRLAARSRAGVAPGE